MWVLVYTFFSALAFGFNTFAANTYMMRMVLVRYTSKKFSTKVRTTLTLGRNVLNEHIVNILEEV